MPLCFKLRSSISAAASYARQMKSIRRDAVFVEAVFVPQSSRIQCSALYDAIGASSKWYDSAMWRIVVGLVYTMCYRGWKG